MFKIKYLVLALLLTVSGGLTLEAGAQAAPTVAKLAKDFSVSPKLLRKFSKAGMSVKDLGSGLKIAKEVSNLKNLSIDDAAERVLNLRQGGKNWGDIAGELGVDLPAGIDAAEGLKKLSTE